MRTFLDIFGQTMRTLWAHKLRSFLTMFGIAWGVGSLLLLIGLGEGFRSGNVKQLNTIGENIMFIFPGEVPPIPGSPVGAKPYFLTYDDWVEISKTAPHVAKSTPVINRGDIRAQSEYQSFNGQVFGILPVYNQIRYLPQGGGRWMNDQDEKEERLVAVIGWESRKSLYPGRPVLGETLLLNGLRFQVIGFLDSTGKSEFSATNQRVFIPLSVMRKYFPQKNTDQAPPDAVSFINFQPTTKEDHLLARDEVRKIIARRKNFDATNEDAFRDWDTIRNAEMVGKIFTAMNLFLGSVGLVTLALGAIGIMNIMLVSVAERTKEIGLRMALGATKRNILTQFFLEGAILTLVSGFVGLGAASAFMTALNQLPAPPGFDPPQLVAWSAALAIGTLALFGIFAGLYPAKKAAMLQPVEALRKE
ncbi:MAG: ABC transporter permease [Acidobacteriales bacterium]|nr:ABC transporter permease [Terriglobales bacterium]